jgi:hypothetical protein
MFEYADTLLLKRRLVVGSIYITANLLIICLLAPLVQTYRNSLTAKVQSSYNSQASDTPNNSQNPLTNTLSETYNDVRHVSIIMESKMLSGVMSFATGVTHFDRDIARDTGRTITSTLNLVSDYQANAENSNGLVFNSMERPVFSFFGLFNGQTHISSIIQPQDHAVIPVITKLEIQQAALIQSGTRNVTVAAVATVTGIGGACDSGSGNGGYPMSWCNAPMDSEATIPYTSEAINRECTSYAYWYFTSVEGHTNFVAWGNAKYWATSSNYPTRANPTVQSYKPYLVKIMTDKQYLQVTY